MHRTRELSETVAHVGLVLFDDGARRMIGLGDFHSGISKRAATRLHGAGLFEQEAEERFNLRARIPGVSRDRLVPPPPGFRLYLAQVLRHELVLGGEVAIEAHLVCAGFRGDGVDADGMNPAAVEELAGRPHYAIAHALLRLRRNNLFLYSGLRCPRSNHYQLPLDTLLTGH